MILKSKYRGWIRWLKKYKKLIRQHIDACQRIKR